MKQVTFTTTTTKNNINGDNKKKERTTAREANCFVILLIMKMFFPVLFFKHSNLQNQTKHANCNGENASKIQPVNRYCIYIIKYIYEIV